MILPTPTSLFIALTVTLKSTDDGRLKTKLYDKCDDFQIVTFPIISSNILASPTYGVILGSVHNAVILWRAQLLTQKILKQGYVAHWLKSSLQKNVWSSSKSG